MKLLSPSKKYDVHICSNCQSVFQLDKPWADIDAYGYVICPQRNKKVNLYGVGIQEIKREIIDK